MGSTRGLPEVKGVLLAETAPLRIAAGSGVAAVVAKAVVDTGGCGTSCAPPNLRTREWGGGGAFEGEKQICSTMQLTLLEAVLRAEEGIYPQLGRTIPTGAHHARFVAPRCAAATKRCDPQALALHLPLILNHNPNIPECLKGRTCWQGQLHSCDYLIPSGEVVFLF